MLRGIKDLGKAVIRQCVRWRLKCLPLSLSQAEQWSERIKRWPAILGTLNFHRERTVRSGALMEVGLIDVVERHLLVEGDWDPLVRRVLEEALRPGAICFDIGANIGTFTLLASRLVGAGGLVVAFEPSVRALRRLAHHLTINACENVVVVSSALGQSQGLIKLGWAPESNIGASAIGRHDSHFQKRQEQISVARLDEVVERMALVPDLLKIDVEGFEMQVLRGGEKTLQQHHPVVVLELTDRFLNDHGDSAVDLVAFMEKLGYRTFLLEPAESTGISCRECTGNPHLIPVNQVEVVFSAIAPKFLNLPAAASVPPLQPSAGAPGAAT